MEARLQRIEGEVVDVRERVSILEERDRRLHEDMGNLTSALEENTKAVSRVNRIADKRGAFVAGIVFIIGAIGTAVGFVLSVVKDWLFQ